jgi:hypothetical protein
VVLPNHPHLPKNGDEEMNKKSLVLVAATLMSFGIATPSHAENGILNNVLSLFGSVTATIVGVPEGILVDSLYRMPLKTTKVLAEKFGDEKGFQQNVAGAVIGIPVGFVWGIPYGAVRGGRHGMTTGWEKPFQTESFIVSSDEG